ncbi:CpsD/CapB family tyrosine-protein kinase [Granulicella sp. dw_53]|uniref:CpsD/CapB family tyrosine-protein kinase n=1 Tax=Granulicella sp. dw_53 TaxID=2719792 RepID=UPI001BD5D41E|nr:CpsD/CapB family tyrosine-protein kinase [Granulicella sp. dw_53]
MSRIYEALQKAESERKATQGSQQTIPNGLRSEAAVAEYEIPVGQRPDLTREREFEVEAPEILSPYAAPALDLNNVPRHTWTPNYTQLPSLQERGPAVEQFRSLRSRIHELRDIHPLKSILVSSGLPQEGKSFVAANLAVSLARHKNSKVLLIDGDMRRYTLHQLLGCQPHPGLADYLAGKAEMIEVMQRAEDAPALGKQGAAILPNLTFIAGGNGGDKAADLSGNPRFGELIRAASPYFDWIIVDSSPVLPVSDAVNLARSCDGVLLVARGGVTKFPVAQRAQSELKASNILGFVLNAIEQAPQVGTYYGYDAEKEE